MCWPGLDALESGLFLHLRIWNISDAFDFFGLFLMHWNSLSCVGCVRICWNNFGALKYFGIFWRDGVRGESNIPLDVFFLNFGFLELNLVTLFTFYEIYYYSFLVMFS